jgi:hypothetical protein
MSELFTTSDLVAKLKAEMSKLEQSVLKTPPATWEAFNRTVGHYAGLETAANLLIESERSLRRKDGDDGDDGRGDQKSRSRF